MNQNNMNNGYNNFQPNSMNNGYNPNMGANPNMGYNQNMGGMHLWEEHLLHQEVL